jgi:hypothetical protein
MGSIASTLDTCCVLPISLEGLYRVLRQAVLIREFVYGAPWLSLYRLKWSVCADPGVQLCRLSLCALFVFVLITFHALLPSAKVSNKTILANYLQYQHDENHPSRCQVDKDIHKLCIVLIMRSGASAGVEVDALHLTFFSKMYFSA